MDMKRKRRKIEHKPLSTRVCIKEPRTVEDLVTHSKKIAEVRGWLESMKSSPHILLVTGPSGSAKTVTLKLVAKSLGIDIQEWVTPVDKIDYMERGAGEALPYDSSAYTEPKQIDKFEAFAFRSSRYQTLFSSNSRRIILVEDFPNHFIWKPETFFEFLSKYKTIGQCPIVFICTDDEKLNLSQNLFPSNIRDNFFITNIKFNPVTHTALMKVLGQSAGFLSKEILNNIAQTCNGDIRAALSTLQFLSGNKCVSKEATEIVAKDAATEFFHTLGRVLYPKRLDQPVGRIFVYDVEAIAEHYNPTFLLMLQENFVSTFSNLVDVIEGCHVLSDCALLCHAGEDLEKYVGYICVTGLMLANKLPKKGNFRAFRKSRWSAGLAKYEGSARLYPHMEMTNRTLNLDVIPYLKHFPHLAGNLRETDADRLRCVGSGSAAMPLFKAPPTPCDAHEDDSNEMIIEEFED